VTTSDRAPAHDPATCPGCLNADPPLGAARGIGIALVLEIAAALVFGVAVYLIGSNVLAVLAR
jgi:LDH2 family malate/lactate/ureidoglycolate dehydrogenase